MSALAPSRLEADREERLRMLLVEFALGRESGKQFDVDEMRTLGEDLSQLLGEITFLRSDLRGLRDQGIADAREITRLTQTNEGLNAALIDANNRLATASRHTEQLLQAASIRLQGQTADFNRIREIRDALDSSVCTITTAIAPRAAAAGAH